MQAKRGRSQLPTPWGDFLMVGFEGLAAGRDHVALSIWRYFRGNPGSGSRTLWC